jgi:hypothetical protein
MGACSSDTVKIQPEELSSDRKWMPVPEQVEAQESYIGEGTITGMSSRDQLEFRALLDYPIAMDYLGVFVCEEKPELQMCFLCWVRLRSFAALPENYNRLVEAQSIYGQCIRDNPYIHTSVQMMVSQNIIRGAENSALLVGAFDIVYIKVFLLLFHKVYAAFKEWPRFVEMKTKMSKTYNNVGVDDFDYMGVIGKGGFGLVCDVRKRSSGIRYAMKIQAKTGIVQDFGNEAWRACLEMRAFASCKHPFIVGLCAAFQTDSLLILVMTLGTWCDLSKLLRAHGPLSYNHVRFYSAEITCALTYLHAKHFVYRDLKPANVLLNADGHIQLVDFGSVCDLSGKTLGKFAVSKCGARRIAVCRFVCISLWTPCVRGL